MIEGLKLKVDCRELMDHCIRRSEYHTQRANEKEGKLPELKKSLEVIKGNTIANSISNMGKGGYHMDPDDPIKDLERDIQEHRNKALVFKFFSEHIFPEDYTLKEEDLIRLEIIKR